MSQSPEIRDETRIACAASGEFQGWLSQAGGSLAITTYQAGKVAMVGWDGRQVTLLMREFDKPLGLAVCGGRLALATRHDLWIFANAPLLARDYLEDSPGRYDGLYLPRVTFHTGAVHTHDVAFQGDDLLLVNTRFSCLARLSRDHSFTPVWRPKFVSDLVPEDRCHLNGVVVQDGGPKYVTALGTTDTAGGWRENKAAGGVLIDVETDEIVVRGMSMPHSPRWYDGRLWVLNSGMGELLIVDPSTGESTSVCGLPGYLRGLCFVGPYALVGMSKIRETHIFGGLPIQERARKLLCGVAVIDLRSGLLAGMLEFTSGCEELYDVQFLPGIRQPMILNMEKPAVRLAITSPDSSFWLRASAEIREAEGPMADAGRNRVAPLPAKDQDGEMQTRGDLLPDSGTQF
ncbi:MAG: TIGR03032 family protein [Planctomycetota bacterium]